MPARKRAAERKRRERHPKIVPGWTVKPVGVIVQTEQTWAERERDEADARTEREDAR